MVDSLHPRLRIEPVTRKALPIDVNADPAKYEHSLSLDGKSAAPDVARLLQTCELYHLNAVQAKTILAEVRTGLSGWRQLARVQVIPKLEITHMSALIQA